MICWVLIIILSKIMEKLYYLLLINNRNTVKKTMFHGIKSCLKPTLFFEDYNSIVHMNIPYSSRTLVSLPTP